MIGLVATEGSNVPRPLQEHDPMTIEQIRAAYDAQPFRPFVMHLADGRSIPVGHREFIATAPSGRTIVVYQPDDSFNVVDLLLITDLEFKRAANGGARKRRA
jgi:hypothetical protein